MIWCHISVILKNHSIPKIVHHFRSFPTFLLSSAVCRTSGCQYLSERSPWQSCTSDPRNRGECSIEVVFAQGWLHANKGVSKDQEVVGYFFALLLHQNGSCPAKILLFSSKPPTFWTLWSKSSNASLRSIFHTHVLLVPTTFKLCSKPNTRTSSTIAAIT